MRNLAAEDMVCNYCALRLHDKCRGRCLCTHDDPVVMAAQALALTIAHYRHMLNDAAYESVLPAFERLSAALSVPVEIPRPRKEDSV